jgi:hypothetical protein
MVNNHMVASVVLTAVLLRIQVFRDPTLCRWVSANRHFGEDDASVFRDRCKGQHVNMNHSRFSLISVVPQILHTDSFATDTVRSKQPTALLDDIQCRLPRMTGKREHSIGGAI